MVRLRTATAADRPFLERTLAVAADWRPGSVPRPADEVLADPALAHYVVGWPRPGDLGVIADDDAGTPLGAAWCRSFTVDDPGYGFVAPDVPELAIGVAAEARGRGIGRRLLVALVARARERGVERISLSVEPDNPAVALYASVGFVAVGSERGSLTMVLDRTADATAERTTGSPSMDLDAAADELLGSLATRADADFAASVQRYFPHGVQALGVRNAVVVEVAEGFLRDRGDVPPATRLLLAEQVLARAEHHEEVLVGFALLHRVARTGFGGELLDRCERWLESSVSNWAQCDDLCLKLLYPFFLGHLEQLPQTRRWVDSESPWARRAANVAVVKFVRRKVGRSVFELPLSHVFDNCTRLVHDDDVYVQKSCGWLLKVAGGVHPDEVAGFLRRWHAEMDRATFRYAIEKLDPQTRRSLMALGSEAGR